MRLFYILNLTISSILLSCATHENRKIASEEKKPVQIIGKRFLFEKYIDDSGLVQYYYLPSARKTAPLIISIQGSDCSSLFFKKGDVTMSRGSQVSVAELVAGN